jgi:hypothetical protein
VKSLQKSKIAQIYYYDPQSAEINMQSPQSDLTPWTLTLDYSTTFTASRVAWVAKGRDNTEELAFGGFLR